MILRSDVVAPVAGPPIADGFVEVQGAQVTRVGRATELGHGWAPDVARGDLHLHHTILTPGLVNPHAHLELTGYAGRIPPQPLWPWLAALVRLRREPDSRKRERDAVAEGAALSLSAGVTCVGDVSRYGDAWRVLDPLPIRKVCFAELLALADQPPRTPDELKSCVQGTRFTSPLGNAGVSPHAPYTVPAEQAAQAIRWASEQSLVWTIHLAETREEVQFLAGDASGLPPVILELQKRFSVQPCRGSVADYVETVASGATGGLLVHMNYLTDDDIARLATSGHTVVFCPRAHRFFGHGAHPFPRLMRGGVKVVIGTDSLASNQSLSILDELRCVMETFPGIVTASELLRMATLDAAAALGLDKRVGSIEPGKEADLAAFPMEPGEAVDRAVERLLRNAPPAAAVWVGAVKVV